MSIKRYGLVSGDNIKTYMCSTTDLVADYPTIDDCDPGSEMTVINETIHEIDSVLFFDGEHWNSY